jgi:predicted RNase H-like HicB family nuclease
MTKSLSTPPTKKSACDTQTFVCLHALNSMEKDIKYYLSLPYTKVLIEDEDGSVFAKIEELHGCMTVGDNQEEALEMLEDALCAWLEVALEMGKKIPETHEKE